MRTFSKREVGLIEAMAQEPMVQLRESAAGWDGLLTTVPPEEPSSSVGQRFPS